MKKILTVLLTAVLMLSVISCTKTVYICGECGANVEPDDNCCPSCGAKIVIPDSDANGITYRNTTLNEIYEEYEQNPARAEKLYDDKYVCIEGKIAEINDSDCFEIVDRDAPQYAMLFSASASCKVKTDELKDIILQMNKEDYVVIKGKITNIDSFVMLSVDIVVDSIIIE